jgi:hypothetical protein
VAHTQVPVDVHGAGSISPHLHHTPGVPNSPGAVFLSHPDAIILDIYPPNAVEYLDCLQICKADQDEMIYLFYGLDMSLWTSVMVQLIAENDTLPMSSGQALTFVAKIINSLNV